MEANTEDPTARDTSATRPEPRLPTTDLGSRPTMTDDPIDNDGDKTPHPVSAGPLSPPDASTPDAAPATTGTTAPLALALVSVVAPPDEPAQGGASKPKRGKGKAAQLDLDAWGRCCRAWDTIAGKIRVWRPEAGDGKTIAEAMVRDGAAKIVARFEQAVRDPWCCSTARDSGRSLSVSALTRSGTAVTLRLDSAAEQAVLDAASIGGKRPCEPSRASGGVGVGVVGQNAPHGQQGASWGDVLRDLGSDPQTHPEDGPHRKAWPEVRAAIYSATRTAGDAWETWRKADDPTRQKVERVLSRRVMA